ncbi:MAG TPA: MFS transporter [Chloroflexota bacterium]|nr:MFS transporter [Chloroflexota bacterium]
MAEETKEDLFAPHVGWNFSVMGMDIALFTGGVSFSSWNTILPLFIRHLTSSNLVLGLMPAIRSVAANLPPVLISPHVSTLARYKPFVLWLTLLERLPYLVLALCTLWLGVDHRVILLLVFFLMSATWSFGGGITTPAWLNLISLMIPTRLRGRFFGFAGAGGGLLGIAAAAITALILHGFPYPTNFALCFLATFAFLVLSFVCLAIGHEPGVAAGTPRAPSPPLGPYLRALPDFLRRERNFTTFLLAGTLANVGIATSPFITAAASRSLHVSDAQVGVYGAVLMAASMMGSIGWGWLGDHLGYRPVLITGTAAGVVCMALAVLADATGTPTILYGVFLLLGTYSSATQLASVAAVVEFGALEERPTFVSLSYLVQTPVALLVPVAGGVVADHAGYSPVFLAVAASLIAAVALYVFKLKDPRKKE